MIKSTIKTAKTQKTARTATSKPKVTTRQEQLQEQLKESKPSKELRSKYVIAGIEMLEVMIMRFVDFTMDQNELTVAQTAKVLEEVFLAGKFSVNSAIKLMQSMETDGKKMEKMIDEDIKKFKKKTGYGA